MKKFMYFVASLLSLSVIFGAGWASGVGKISANTQQTVKNIVQPDDLDTNCPYDEGDEGFDEHYFIKRGFKFRLPTPPDIHDRLTGIYN